MATVIQQPERAMVLEVHQVDMLNLSPKDSEHRSAKKF